MTLPYDYTRCMAVGCPDEIRLRCARHRDLPTQDHVTHVSWARSLHPWDRKICPSFLPWEEPLVPVQDRLPSS